MSDRTYARTHSHPECTVHCKQFLGTHSKSIYKTKPYMAFFLFYLFLNCILLIFAFLAVYAVYAPENKGLTNHAHAAQSPFRALSHSVLRLFISLSLSLSRSLVLNAMTIAIIVNCQMALTIFACCFCCWPLHLPARSIVCVGVEICKWKQKWMHMAKGIREKRERVEGKWQTDKRARGLSPAG